MEAFVPSRPHHLFYHSFCISEEPKESYSEENQNRVFPRLSGPGKERAVATSHTDRPATLARLIDKLINCLMLKRVSDVDLV
jgi:hypothetical protein